MHQGAGVVSKVANVKPNCSLTSSFPSSSQAFLNSNHVGNSRASQQAPIRLRAEPCHGSRQTPVALPFPIMRGTSNVNPIKNRHQVKKQIHYFHLLANTTMAQIIRELLKLHKIFISYDIN